jgi:uncharacterized protein (TIGR00255 family)
MPLQSMTGFGKAEVIKDGLSLVVEMKSVNHRFRDVRFKMSSIFNPIEMELRKKLEKKYSRGSFDIFINYKKSEDGSKFDELDKSKIKKFINKMKEISVETEVPLQMRAVDFLRNEFYVEQTDDSVGIMQEMMVEAFEAALVDLEKARMTEGEKLLVAIKGHKKNYEELFSIIEKRIDSYQKDVEERLKKKFQEVASEIKIEESRYMQEVVYYLEKMDVHEEINRIKVHLSKFDIITSLKTEIGRQFDFLIQELNRETNTIGSKSSTNEISEAVVGMKVQLEKIREQALNLE